MVTKWANVNVHKGGTIYVECSTTIHNLSFCAHALCLSYLTNMFLLVNSSVSIVANKAGVTFLCILGEQKRKPGERGGEKIYACSHTIV